MGWEDGPGLVVLPDGTRVRGRGLRAGPAPQRADWTLFLLGAAPPDPGHPHRWVRWPDFWLPTDRSDARTAFAEALARARAGVRVEVVCSGGRGRTGTAIACLAQLAGLDAGLAVEWTRTHYHRRAVETPWQRRYVRRFGAARVGGGEAQSADDAVVRFRTDAEA
ncbi:protein-tyrosine phosphatase family protein [Patulibacter americanus]|uniref:protein-tyrosine phosphatase family protein n=1 Tax=Patulibacter americanus TaxID=588672 RepID=UPI0003B318DB|nr:hypothetical protein [Patulibacter americanus]